MKNLDYFKKINKNFDRSALELHSMHYEEKRKEKIRILTEVS